MQCNKCLHTIDRKKERYTEGKCAKRYHAQCVGLSEVTVCALFSKNIVWMCDDCLLDFCNSRDDNADNQNVDTCCTHQSTCEAEIEGLNIKVNEIMDVLGTIVSESSIGNNNSLHLCHHQCIVVIYSMGREIRVLAVM